MNKNPSQPLVHPYAGIAVGILAVSAASIIIRQIQFEGLPSPLIAAGRLAIASLALAPLALTRYRAEILSLSRRDLFLAALTGVFLGVHFATWIASLEYTSVASSVVFVSTSPIFVGLFSLIVWRESLSPSLIAGLILSLVGGAVVGLADACHIASGGIACPPLAQFVQGRAFFGDLLALAGAIAVAGYLLIGRRLRAKLSLIAYIFLAYSAAALTMLVYVLALGVPVLGYSATGYFWLMVLGLVPQLIGHSALNWALRYLSAIYVSVTILGEPIGSTVLALFLLDETPSALNLIGGGLILIGIVLASRRN